MSRRTRWFLALFTLTALGVTAFWLHHTRIAIGWWRGEAFYQGRPTSYWESELSQWDRATATHMTSGVLSQTALYARRPGWTGRLMDRFGSESSARNYPLPGVLTGDPDSESVLMELRRSSDARIVTMAADGLAQLEPTPTISIGRYWGGLSP